ncbi:MAG: hypothetical protein GVY09_12350 [Gammaproteobacteria bacterium]|nr:hypothetical protein [Gammaproteobacteria bacterium]
MRLLAPERSARCADPLSKLAQYDAAAEPLAGIPVLGPHWHVPKVSPQMRSINAA